MGTSELQFVEMGIGIDTNNQSYNIGNRNWFEKFGKYESGRKTEKL